MRKHLVLTASGNDRPGVVEDFTKLILHFEGNVETSRMTRLGGAFAMLMLISAPEGALESLRAALAELHYAKYDVHTRLTEVQEVPGGAAYIPCGITVSGADHMGIINKIAGYLAEQGINIETMNTEVVAAPMSGAPLFTMSAVIRVPNRLDLADVREALEFIGDEMGVETATFAHVD